jgi:hypothetical protein
LSVIRQIFQRSVPRPLKLAKESARATRKTIDQFIVTSTQAALVGRLAHVFSAAAAVAAVTAALLFSGLHGSLMTHHSAWNFISYA